MTTVHIKIEVATAGGLEPAVGSMLWTPTRRRETADSVVLPASFRATLVDGVLDIAVAPTTAEWVWRVDEQFSNAPAQTFYLAVVDSAEPVNYKDLVAIDPVSLEPAAVPEPAWVAMAESTVTSGTVTGNDLILTRTDGTTVNAGNVRGSDGAIGADGDSAYEVAVANGFVGTEAQWLTSLKGADGSDATVSEKLGISEIIRPDWQFVYHVGPTRTYTTVLAAVTAARADGHGFAKNGATVDTTNTLNSLSRGGRPEFARAVVAVDPGTYTETGILDIGDGIDLIGTGATPSDVVITNGAATFVYNARSYGGVYVSNLTLLHTPGPAGNNYPFHGSSIPGVVDYTGVFDNVRFVEQSANSSGVVGWDMVGGMMLFFYRCSFESTNAKNNILHDQVGYAKGVTVVFLECSASASVTYTVNVANIGKGDVWVKDCTKAGAAVANTVTIDTGAAQTTKASPPMPIQGMTRQERARYYPTRAKGNSELLVPDYPDVSPMTFTAGRVYYIPLPTMPFSALTGKARTIITTAAGTVAVGIYMRNTANPTKPTSPVIYSNAKTAVNGLLEFDPIASWSPFFLDVGMQLWMAVRVNDASCQLLGSTQMSRTTTCYYEDGAAGTATPTFPTAANVLPLAAGTAVPWAGFLTA